MKKKIRDFFYQDRIYDVNWNCVSTYSEMSFENSTTTFPGIRINNLTQFTLYKRFTKIAGHIGFLDLYVYFLKQNQTKLGIPLSKTV